MKTHLLVLVLCFFGTSNVFAQKQDVDNKVDSADFEVIKQIFNNNLDPLIEGLIRKQYPDEYFNSIPAEAVLTARVLIIKSRVASISNDIYIELIRSKYNNAMEPEFIFNVFEDMYRIEFLGLDYNYFQKCVKDFEEISWH